MMRGRVAKSAAPGVAIDAQAPEPARALIGCGTVGHATEATASEGVAWEADLTVDGKPAFVYRLLRIATLYRYAAP